jgi:uridine kinase
MRGDILIIGDHHRKAAGEIIKKTFEAVKTKAGRYLYTIGGESGSGKSELASALKDGLSQQGINTGLIQQDDYFILPPKSNERKRRQDLTWVGPGEVRLDLLNKHIEEIHGGRSKVVKPLVIFDEDRISSEILDVKSFKVIIIEGTYTGLLDGIDCSIFIDRNRYDTLSDRQKRNREAQDDFLEQVLEIEHKTISTHKSGADIIINKDFSIKLNK